MHTGAAYKQQLAEGFVVWSLLVCCGGVVPGFSSSD